MKRLFYLSLGVAAGVYATQRLHRAAHAWTPEGIARSAAGVGAAVRDVAEEVRSHAAERETELREILGLDGPLDHVHAAPVSPRRRSGEAGS